MMTPRIKENPVRNADNKTVVVLNTIGNIWPGGRRSQEIPGTAIIPGVRVWMYRTDGHFLSYLIFRKYIPALLKNRSTARFRPPATWGPGQNRLPGWSGSGSANVQRSDRHAARKCPRFLGPDRRTVRHGTAASAYLYRR